MSFVSLILMGIASNLDNLCVGLLMGVQKKRITALQNGLIALFSGATTFIFCQIASYFQGIGRISGILGGALLILVGVWSFLPKRESDSVCEEAGKTRQGPLFSRESLMIAWALAVNCIPIALGAGLTGISAFPAALSIAGFSFLTVGVGSFVGVRIGKSTQTEIFTYLSGALMVVLGLVEIFF